MNDFSINENKKPNKEHGTITSYVAGFVLSLIYTLIPYYLVVNHRFSTSALVTTIISFGIAQMIIQVVFFLHLGRGPKPFYNVVFFFATVGLIVVVVGGSIFIMDNLHYNMTPAEASKQLAEKEAIYQVEGKLTGACQKLLANHVVTISGGKVTPLHTNAQLCDTLTFINQDSRISDIAFGPHPKHETYAGETELTVKKGKNKTITLNQAGIYQYHDHLDPTIAGDFIVAK